MPVDSRIWFRAWCAWLKCEPLPLLADLDLDRLPVSDCQRALTWYERLPGSGPAFFPNATEAVWELADHRYFYIAALPGRAGFLQLARQRCAHQHLCLAYRVGVGSGARIAPIGCSVQVDEGTKP